MSCKDLLADINGESLLKAWIGEKRNRDDEGRETRVRQSRHGAKHAHDLFKGEGRIMDINKLIELNRARLDFLSSQQKENDRMNDDPNLFDSRNGIYDDIRFQQQSEQQSHGLRSQGSQDPSEVQDLMDDSIA